MVPFAVHPAAPPDRPASRTVVQNYGLVSSTLFLAHRQAHMLLLGARNQMRRMPEKTKHSIEISSHFQKFLYVIKYIIKKPQSLVYALTIALLIKDTKHS